MSDTTGFDVNEKVNVLFKTAMGFPSTKESTNWFQETNVPYNTYVFGSDILTDDIPTNPTYGAAKTSASVGLTDNDFDTGGFVKDSNDGKVRYYHRLILDQCITNNNDSWHKKNSSGNNVLMDALQFNVNKTASNTPYGYVLTNKANVAADNAAPNEILQNAAGGNWFFDIKSGIVFFPDNSTPSLGVVDNSTKKPVFSFYKYIGNKGLSTWSGGGGGGGGSTTLGGLTDVSTTGATSGQAIVYNGSSWAPGNVASGGGGGGEVTTSETQFANWVRLRPKTSWSYSAPGAWAYVAKNLEIEETVGTVNISLINGTQLANGWPTGTGGNWGFATLAQKDTNDCVVLFNKAGTYRITLRSGIGTCHPLGTHSTFTMTSFIFDKNNNYKTDLAGPAPPNQCHGSANPHLVKINVGDYMVNIQRRGLNGAVNYATDDHLWEAQATEIEYIPDTVQIGGNGEAVLDGQVLETLAGICDGRSITVASGTYTLENVTAKQVIASTTYIKADGSAISYKPPSGTRQVIISYATGIQARQSTWDPIITAIAKIGSSLTTNHFQSWRPQGSGDYGELYHTFTFVIDIGSVSSDDIANGKLASWDVLKDIEINMKSYDTAGYSAIINSTMHDGSTYTNSGIFIPPRLTITAIGRGKSGVALAGTNTANVSTGVIATYTPPKTSPGVEIEHLRLSIKPEYSDSVIYLNWNVFCDGYRNIGFRVTRNINGSDVLVYDDEKAHNGSFLAMVPFDETTTTSGYTSPQTAQISWYDSPNTTSQVTYKLWVGNSFNTGEGFTLNKSMQTVDADGREYGVSTGIAIEHPKPNKALNPITSATQVDGQVLETLAGICDGRTVVGSSGTYILENVTAIQTGSTTWTDVIGSKINYTPPAGTRQVVYEFFVHRRWGSANDRAILHYGLYVDGSLLNITRDTRGGGVHDETWESVMFTFEIGKEDDPTNGKYSSWNTAKAIKVQSRDYSGHYGHRLHESLYWNGSEPAALIVKPHLKITAIGTADYDVVQRVVTYKDGQVLENLVGNCDGRTVTVSSGTYTIQDARGSSAYAGRQWNGQTTTLTWTTIRGSEISYKPPPGTNKVLFKFNFHVRYMDEDCIIYTRLIIDDSDRIFFKEISTREYPSLEVQLAYVIDIGEVDEINDHSAKFLKWDSLKTLKLEVRSHTSSYDAYLFTSQWDSENSGEDVFQFPILEIQAIGRQVAPASAADFKIQKVDTISTLPNNGNMLTWDQAKGRWKPSEFIVSNDDGTKNISDINLYTGYTITDSEDNNTYNRYKAFDDTYKNTYEGYSNWGSQNGRWNTSTGAYTHTGSTVTNIGTLSGAWLQIDFGKKVKVYHVVVGSGDIRSPRIYYIAGSNDNTNWTVVVSKTNTDIATNSGNLSAADQTLLQSQWNYQPTLLNDAGGFGSQLNTLSSPATYRYFRLIATHTYSCTDVHGQMQMHVASLKYYGNFPNERIQTLPVSGVNMSYVNFKDPEIVTINAASGYTEIQGLRLSITPEYSDSVIELNYVVQLEEATYTRDMGAVITRTVNGVETIFRSNGGTDRWDTIQATAGSDAYGHHMHTLSMKYYDEPNTTSSITYKIKLISTDNNQPNKTVYINRVDINTGGDAAETAISVASAKELPKPNTAVLSSVNNSTAVEGQVLETLSGMCDGRSISVASGNYTLQDVTSTILVTGSNNTVGQPNDPWIDLTGSTINYTPPVGTKQVIYEFDYAHSSADTNIAGAMHLQQILLDGVKIEQSFRSIRPSGDQMYEIARERVMCIIDIGEEDDITNNKLKSWSSSREIKIQVASYSSSYKALMHSVQHGRSEYYMESERGGSPGASGWLRKPDIKITAVGTAQYDVVQRVATYKDGQVLETFAGVCDGRSITVSSGTYTLENVTGRQNGTMTFTPITGSRITYKPPPGTKQVIYEFTVHVIPNGDGGSVNLCGHYKMYLGGTEVEIMYNTHQLIGQYPETEYNIQMIINIGEKNDIANAHILNWDTPLEMRVDGQSYDTTDDEVTWHKQYYFQGVNVTTDESKYQHPTLKITAIGRSVEPASAADFKIQRVNTLSSEPDNGSVLLYDSGKKEWTASGTRMEDQDIRLLSDPAVHVGHELTASSIHNDSDEYYEPHHAFNYTQTQYYNSVWASASGTYATTGAYAGSTSTEGYNGEWIQINFKRKAKIYYYGVMAEKRLDVKRAPKSWRLYGSNNGTNWTQLDEQQDRLFDNWWSKNQSSEWPSGTTSQHTSVVWGMKLQKIELSQPAIYQYFRMVVNEKNSDAHNKIHLNFLGFYGVWNTISATTSVQAGTNMVYNSDIVYKNVNIGYQTILHYEWQEMRMVITPQYSDSVIELKYNIFGDLHNDVCFRITRNISGTDVSTDVLVVPASAYNRGVLGIGIYDADHTTTPNQHPIAWYDEPNTTLTVTYKLWIGSSTTGGGQCHLNRSANALGNYAEEGVSTGAAIEHPKPQAILSTVSNSTALEGQVLETFAGVCDGRSITVSSGTYTLENVTAQQVPATSNTVITGSTINYKPPSGTKQLIYIFEFVYGYYDARPIIDVNFFIDNTEVTIARNTLTTENEELTYKYKVILSIGETDDIANGKISSWNSLKTLHTTARNYSGSFEGELHYIDNGVPNGQQYVQKPKLEITAVGTTYHTAVPRIVTKKSGQLLETIAGMCDGRSITSASGTYTLENITQGTLLSSLSGNFIDFPGSSINYKPPSGTKQVFYTFQFATGRNDNSTSLGFMIFIDGVEATIFKKYYGTNGDYGSGLHTIHFVIDIGSVSSDDIANGKLATWNTSKTIKVQVGVESNSYETWINKTFYDIQHGQANANNADTSHNASTYVRKPLLKIEAFGEGGVWGHPLAASLDGKIGIGTDSPEYELDIRGTGWVSQNITSNGTDPCWAATRYGVGPSASHGPLLYIGAQKWASPNSAGYPGGNLCFINSRDDYPLVFLQYNVEAMRIHDNGNVGIGNGAESKMTTYDYKKVVVYQTGTGHGIFSEGSATQTNQAYTARNSSGTDTWAIRYNGTTAVSSDDRLKHNEIELTNVLDIIDRLKPVRYFKTGKMFEENHNFELDSSGNPITTDDYHIETGLIAQQVNTIPELQYCVGGGSNEITGDQPYNVNYNDIFVYNIAATKELHKKVISLETKNTELETKNTELETKNTELENRVKELENIIKETENKVNDAKMKVNTVYHKNGLLEAEIMMIKNKIGL